MNNTPTQINMLQIPKSFKYAIWGFLGITIVSLLLAIGDYFFGHTEESVAQKSFSTTPLWLVVMALMITGTFLAYKKIDVSKKFLTAGFALLAIVFVTEWLGPNNVVTVGERTGKYLSGENKGDIVKTQRVSSYVQPQQSVTLPNCSDGWSAVVNVPTTLRVRWSQDVEGQYKRKTGTWTSIGSEPFIKGVVSKLRFCTKVPTDAGESMYFTWIPK